MLYRIKLNPNHYHLDSLLLLCHKSLVNGEAFCTVGSDGQMDSRLLWGRIVPTEKALYNFVLSSMSRSGRATDRRTDTV